MQNDICAKKIGNTPVYVFRGESRFKVNLIIWPIIVLDVPHLASLIFNPQSVVRHIAVSMKFYDLYILNVYLRKCIPTDLVYGVTGYYK